jgi:hypothetical protein
MIFLTMIFLHIVDDYYLQGILAQMKQKKFWKEQAPDELYKYDYIWALIMHAFSWTFMIMLPLIFVSPISPAFYVIFVVNLAVHAYVDNLKANKHKINLWQDQLIHLAQIILTFIIL